MRCKRCCGSPCCRACGVTILLVLASVSVKWSNVFLALLELPRDCAHPALPVNQTGLKVLVAAFAKTGTRTVAHALNDIGIRTYHSEDMCLFSYREYVRNMRAKHEEYREHSHVRLYAPLLTDPRASEELSSAVSRCRVEGVALDGMEKLTLPLLSMSPGVRVIILDWRTYNQYRKSHHSFIPKLGLMGALNLLTSASTALLPWTALLRVLDPIAGGPIAKALSEGGPPICEVCGPMMALYAQSLNHYNHGSTLVQEGAHKEVSLMSVPRSEQEYNSFFELIRQQVPAEARISMDPRKATFEDLCRFMDVHPCPRTGRFQRTRNTFPFQINFPFSAASVFMLRIFLYWVNWRLILGTWLALRRCFAPRDTKAHAS